MSAEVSIDYATVEKMANTFANASETMNGISGLLNGAAALLQASGFAGLIGTVSQLLLNAMSDNATAIGTHCSDLDGDLKKAVEALRNGDTSGAERFAV
jgi:uncharacterized protein YukE